jgi:hypothetical protein
MSSRQTEVASMPSQGIEPRARSFRAPLLSGCAPCQSSCVRFQFSKARGGSEGRVSIRVAAGRNRVEGLSVRRLITCGVAPNPAGFHPLAMNISSLVDLRARGA